MRRKPGWSLTIDEARGYALQAARDMVRCCEANKWYGHYTGFTSINEALASIEAGQYGFGDICDDNVFLHRVLSKAGVVPKDTSRNSQASVDRWNDVGDQFAWAAGFLLQEDKLFNYARTAVRSEIRNPFHGRGAHYESQAVMSDVLNHFDWLTGSDEDLERVTEAVNAAESELLCVACQDALKAKGQDECKGCLDGIEAADRRLLEAL